MSAAVEQGDVERFRGLIAERFGLYFDDEKRQDLAATLAARVVATKSSCSCTLPVTPCTASSRGSRTRSRALAETRAALVEQLERKNAEDSSSGSE